MTKPNASADNYGTTLQHFEREPRRSGCGTKAKARPRTGSGSLRRRYLCLGSCTVWHAGASKTKRSDGSGVMIAAPRFRFGQDIDLATEIPSDTLAPPTEDRFSEVDGFFLRELSLHCEVTDKLDL